MTRHSMRIIALALVLALACSVQAQDREVTVDGVVTRVQARGAYFDVDQAPFVVGDTVTVLLDPTDVRVRVAGVTTTSLLVVWVDPAPGLAVGDQVRIQGQATSRQDAPAANPADRPTRGSVLDTPGARTAAASRKEGLRLSGYYASSLTASYSDIRGRFTSNRSSSRSWATPTGSLRLRATGLPAGLQFTASLRGAHRLSSEPISGQATMMQLFEMNLSHGSPSDRLQFTAGRFRDANSPMGGYWDGLRSSVGIGAFRFGAAAGLEPDRYSEAWSTDTRKVLAFTEWSSGRKRVRTNLQAAVGAIQRDALPGSYLFVTAEHTTRVGRLRLSNDVQLDRSPADGSWSLGRWNTRISSPLTERLSANARIGVRHYYAYWLDTPTFSSERTQLSGGLHYQMQHHAFGLTATSNQFTGRERNLGLSLLARTQPSWSPIQLTNTSSVWNRASGNTFYSTTRFEHPGTRLTYGLEYSILLVDQVGPWQASHIGGLFARWSTERWGYFSLRQRMHIGSAVLSSTSFVTWGVSF